MKKVMDHAAYQRTLKSKTNRELRFILEDTNDVLIANPEGENAGYYMDEHHYAAMELVRRAKITHRQRAIHEAVVKQGRKIAAVARAFGISPSTVRRDLDAVTES